MPKKTYRRNGARRVIDGLASSMTRLGLGSRTGVLVTHGRRSGEPRSTPVDPTRLDGQLYVVGIYGVTGWVRNLRAEPRCRVSSGRQETEYTAHEVPPNEAAPVLRAYLQASSFTRDYQDVGLDDPDEAFEVAAANRPTFRLEPAADA
jgi:deazaflavin-dependent oxidoreductase (nitroreductase family)